MNIELPTATGGREHKRQIAQFALSLIELSEKIGFRMSARGWAYTLEGLRLINKDQFDRVESLINSCREKGYLPIDFTAEEEGRKFSGVEKPTEEDIPSFLKGYIDYVNHCESSFTPEWWKGEQYYIQMLVEKIDLKTLFEPVCQDYKICIATSKGWSSMLQRAEYARRFKEAEVSGEQMTYEREKHILRDLVGPVLGEAEELGTYMREHLVLGEKEALHIEMSLNRIRSRAIEAERHAMNFKHAMHIVEESIAINRVMKSIRKRQLERARTRGDGTMMSRGMSEALDRHITGNYGEDQYKDSEVCDECEKADGCTEDPTVCKMRMKDEALEQEAERKREQQMEDA